MTKPRNEFLLDTHLTTELESLLAARPEPVVKWFKSVFWRHYRQPRPEPVPMASPRIVKKKGKDGTTVHAILTGVDAATGIQKYRRATFEEIDAWDGEEDAPKKKRPMTPEERTQQQYLGLYALREHVSVTNRGAEGVVHIPFADLTDDMLKALRNGADLLMLTMAPAQSGVIQHFIDFLTHYHTTYPDKDLSRISMPQCITMVIEWDKELARQKEIEALKAGTTELFTATNGCKVFLLHSVEAVEREGQRLGNCLKTSAKYYLNESGALIIVRNAEGSTISAAQLIVKLRADADKLVTSYERKQFYGRSNGHAPDEAAQAMYEAAVALDWRDHADVTSPFDCGDFMLAKRKADEPEGEDTEDDFDFDEVRDEELDADVQPPRRGRKPRRVIEEDDEADINPYRRTNY